jgi:ElaB/YqjD/DUF883 family membrane-anchored ribosome-binding protein
MESNNNLGASGSDSNSGAQSDANEFSGSGSPPPQDSSFDFSGATTGEQGQGLKNRAKNALGSANEKLADVGSGVRDKAGSAKDKLANALESGAGRLRDRAGAAALAGVSADGTATIQTDGRIAQVSDKVAGGMQATADWLRDADIEGMKSGIERQVKEHPARTLLIAAGLGYLIGKAFRADK